MSITNQYDISLKSKYLINTIKPPLEQMNNQIKAEKFQIKTPKGTRDYHPHQMAIRRKVIDNIVEVFRRHGAVQIDTPVFELKEVLTGKYGEESKLIYDLQDQGGQKCALRYDLTVPFARFMANNTNIQKIKRFHIGKVYRRDQPTITKGRFRQFYQCDFDIAGKYDPMLPDAQVLAIMQQILEQLGIQDYIVKVNHRSLLEAIIRQSGCKMTMFKTICSSIDKLDKLTWQEVRKQLIDQKGLSQKQANIIGIFTVFKGKPLKLLEQLRKQSLFKVSAEKVQQIWEDMSKLFVYLQAMKRIDKVSFDLSLARGLDYYTGLIYQIVLTDQMNQVGSISGGGRYDELIGMFCQYQIPSVGGSMGIERLFSILEKKYVGKVKQNACEVMVGTIGDVPVTSRLAILSELWRNNIKAETMYVDKMKMPKQINHAFNNGIPMILLIGEQQLKSGELKLKILYKHEQVGIKMNNLIAQILPYIQDFNQDFKKGKVQLEDQSKKKKK